MGQGVLIFLQCPLLSHPSVWITVFWRRCSCFSSKYRGVGFDIFPSCTVPRVVQSWLVDLDLNTIQPLYLRKEFIWSHMLCRRKLGRIQFCFSLTSHKPLSILLHPRLSPNVLLCLECKHNPKDIFRLIGLVDKLGQIYILFKPKCGPILVY